MARRPCNSARAAASSLRNSATSSCSQLWAAINSARHWRTASAEPMRNGRNISSRLGGEPLGQADHLGLGREQRVHLPPQLGDSIELPLQVSDLGLERGDRLVRSSRHCLRSSTITCARTSLWYSVNGSGSGSGVGSGLGSSVVLYTSSRDVFCSSHSRSARKASSWAKASLR